MRNYPKAYSQLLKSGFVPEDTVKKHVRHQFTIDKLLPDSASFFYIVNLNTLDYLFVGKQQKSISGYTNDVFLENGLEFFLKCVHPDEVDVLVNQAFSDLTGLIADTVPEEKKKLQLQYNYRFKRKNGEFVNLLERVYVLEVDDAGRGALMLGNVVLLESTDNLPLKWSAKLIRKNNMSRTILSKSSSPIGSVLNNITSRELDILRNLAIGKTSKEIGDELYISHHTVDTHRRKLLKKLKCRTVVELAQLAFRNALL